MNADWRGFGGAGHRICIALLGIGAIIPSVWSQGTSALPQPDAVLYGSITQSPGAAVVTPATVTWSIQGNHESITAANTTIVTINTEIFYISRVPFETRQIVGGPALPATANVLELTQADTTYTRSVTVDGKAAVLPAGKETFTYGAFSQGLIERIDLVVGESFEEWSERVFGEVVGREDDADGDGRTNRDEWLQGTDAQDAASRSIVRGLAASPGGGFTIMWDSELLRTYRVEKSATLDQPDWQPVGEPIAGTGNALQFVHPPSGEKRLFFRIVVSEMQP